MLSRLDFQPIHVKRGRHTPSGVMRDPFINPGYQFAATGTYGGLLQGTNESGEGSRCLIYLDPPCSYSASVEATWKDKTRKTCPQLDGIVQMSVLD